MGLVYLYTYIWLICMVNVGKSTIQLWDIILQILKLHGSDAACLLESNLLGGAHAQ